MGTGGYRVSRALPSVSEAVEEAPWASPAEGRCGSGCCRLSHHVPLESLLFIARGPPRRSGWLARLLHPFHVWSWLFLLQDLCLLPSHPLCKCQASESRSQGLGEPVKRRCIRSCWLISIIITVITNNSDNTASHSYRSPRLGSPFLSIVFF